MPISLPITVWCYAISGLLDAVDGHAARYFNQSTKFGAMLDQLTDRIGTSCLILTLSYFYPKYMFWFQLSLAIDISCHWIFLHTSILQGKTSHKLIDMSENYLMNIYYTNKPVLFFMCAGNEAFYLSLYCLYFTTGPIVAGLSLFKLICYVSAPIALLKTFISLVHGFVACKNLATIDISEREALRKKK
ncbi:CDP-diacylglycerol--inositol 3-phosphatidyltransferase isoform X2 [Bemisia tabaci]|nr:PREDICTED: CDP-diacylglycerol--inositol 3-phosphatidyltransferase isoform X2 [Bemisia tabaci]